MKKIVLIVVSCLVVGVSLYLALPQTSPLYKDVIYVAVVGPMTGDYKSTGQAMLRGINLYLDHLRETGRSLAGKRIELLIYDDQGEPDVAAQIATTIATGKKALMVLGHSSSTASIAAGPIYQRAEIPAITASATAEAVTQNNEWYFRIVSNNAFQGQFMARYLANILHQTSASVVYYSDEYGRALFQNFENSAMISGLEIDDKHRWSYTKDDLQNENPIHSISQELCDLSDPGAFLLIVDDPEAVRLIQALRVCQPASPILIPELILSSLSDAIEEQSLPKSLADGVYTTTPFLMELGNEQTFYFGQAYQALYHEPPDWLAAGYYDAMSVAFEAMQRANIQGKNRLLTDRRHLKDALAEISNVERSIKGVTGYIYFDKEGDVNKPYMIGVVQYPSIVPAFFQYQEATLQTRSTEHLFTEALTGEIVVINDVILKKTPIVHTGIQVRQVKQIDVKTSTYTIVFDLWFRFQGDFQAAEIEFPNAVNPLTLGQHDFPPPNDEQPHNDITTYGYQNLEATFKGEFDFHTYPLTRQILPIRLHHTTQTNDHLILVPDLSEAPAPLKISGPPAIPPGWSFLKRIDNEDQPFMYQDLVTHISTLGDPLHLDAPQVINYSQINALTWLRQNNLRGLLPLTTPLGIAVVFVLGGLLLPSDWLDRRILLCMFALLSAMSAHILFQQEFEVEYLTLFEYIIFGLYGVIFLTVMVAISAYGFYRNKMALLHGIPILQTCSQPVLSRLSKKMRVHRLRKPDHVIIRQGDPGTSLFVIVKGDVRVIVAQDDGPPVEVERLQSGSYFGEMALLTGEPRSATVVTATRAVVCELTQPHLMSFLKKHSEMVQVMAEEIVHRKFDEFTTINPDQADQFDAETLQKELAHTIKSTFGF